MSHFSVININKCSSTLFTGVAVETGGAGAASVDVVASAAVDAGAGPVAAVAVETGEALCKEETHGEPLP